MTNKLITSFSASPLSRRRLLTAAGGAAAAAFIGGRITPAEAVLKLDVTQGTVQPIPIAIPDFVSGGGPEEGGPGREVNQVITNNLRRSGLFQPLDQASFIERIQTIDANPRFQDWRVINAQALVTGRIGRGQDGRYKVEYRLWDVFSGNYLNGQQFFGQPTT